MNNLIQSKLEELLDRQKQAWLDGSRPSVDALLSDSALPSDNESLLDLIYNEIVVREELGETPSPDEYLRRYPQLQEDLKLHFEVHRAVRENLLLDTRRMQNSDSKFDIDVAVEFGPSLTDYEIIGELGRGGMGVVYKARQQRLKRLVALKMFQPGRSPTARELTRFRAEAEAIARLQHPNIVQIFEVGQEIDKPFLALELAEGGTLAQKLQDLPLQPRVAAELIETLARAVQHAHEQHIIHRDLKPANVLFARDGTPKLTDFGLAKLLEAEPGHDATRTGEPIGTPRYMSPEQAAGKPDLIGPATDVYGLGTMLYECMTGQVPFVSPNVMETIDRIRNEDPVSPRRLQRSIPRDLDTICLACLQKDPARRYATAQELAEDLRRFLHGEPICARRTPVWERAWLWGRRRPALATLLAASFVLLAFGLIFLTIREHHERQRLAQLRTEIAALVSEGQQALARQNAQQAKEKFLAALTKVKAEPALADQELGVRGWYDQSLRDFENQRGKQRRPPPLFEELRDNALVQSVLVDPHQARKAIEAALEFAPEGEREMLVLVDAGLDLREGDAAKALARLKQSNGVSSRVGYERRAVCLERLGRKPEADEERIKGNELPARPALDFFLSGVDCCHRKDFAGAVREFDDVLALEPDHFMGRFLQAACFLELQLPTEAKIALTACIGQRPGFAWSYLCRGQAFVQLEEYVPAAQDYQRSLEVRLREPARHRLNQNLDALRKALAELPAERRERLGIQCIRTETGNQELRRIPEFENLFSSRPK